MLRPCCWYARLFLLGWAAAASTHARSEQSSLDTIYHLHGTVVDGVTGKPVGRALVTSADRRLATLTDGEGHFSVDLSVPPNPASTTAQKIFGFQGGFLVLTATRPGFLADGRMTNIAFDSVNAKDVVLKLMPAARISGHVTALGLDSVSGVQVSLLKRQVQDGAYTWMQVNTRAAGPEGVFRFTNLEPGEYTIMSSEWAGDRAATPAPNEITEQYPPDFLGDSATFAGATKLQVRYGDELQTALQLRAAPFFPVLVPVQNQPQNAPVSVRLVGGDTFNGLRLGWDGRAGAVTGSLPAGSYTLLISSSGTQPAAASVPITVAGRPLQHAPVALKSGGEVTVHVHDEISGPSATRAGSELTGAVSGGRTRQQSFNLFLRPEDFSAGIGGAGTKTGDDGSVVLEHPLPGRYLVQTYTSRGYVAAITSGNVDLLHEALAVGEGGSADPIDVTLRDDGATLTGTVDYGTEASTDPVSLLLLPTDGSSHISQGFTQGSAKFNINNIAPGTYRLLAVHAGRQQEQVPYRDTQAMKAYSSQGTLITLTAGGSASVKVGLSELSDAAKQP